MIMNRLFLLFWLGFLSSQLHAFFWNHAIMTPDNLEEHEEHKIWLYSNEDEPDMVNVVLPYHKGQKNIGLLRLLAI